MALLHRAVAALGLGRWVRVEWPSGRVGVGHEDPHRCVELLGADDGPSERGRVEAAVALVDSAKHHLRQGEGEVRLGGGGEGRSQRLRVDDAAYLDEPLPGVAEGGGIGDAVVQGQPDADVAARVRLVQRRSQRDGEPADDGGLVAVPGEDCPLAVACLLAPPGAAIEACPGRGEIESVGERLLGVTVPRSAAGRVTLDVDGEADPPPVGRARVAHPADGAAVASPPSRGIKGSDVLRAMSARPARSRTSMAR